MPIRLPILLLAVATAIACGEPRQNGDPPRAAFVARSIVPTGTLVTFDASHSQDNGLIISYTFDFGDAAPALVSASPEAEHAYAAAAAYRVTLTVADDLSNEGFATHEIVVTDTYAPCASDAVCATDSECTATECWISPP